MTARSVVERLGDRWPGRVDPKPETGRALAYLDAGIDAETLLKTARAVATLIVAVAVVVGVAVGRLAAPRLGVVVASTGAAVGLAAVLVADRGPTFLATLARTRALGSAASLVGRAALRLRIDPTVERAAAFAAGTGRGALSRSLSAHVEQAAGTPRSGIDAFAEEWHDRFPALERAVTRLDAAASAPAAERDRHLDRAVEASLDGVQEELAAFTGEIRGAVTGLYAFGVLLPLALVGVLPAARATGVRLSLPAVVIIYDVVLPLAVVVAGAWILVRRPVAFPPPRIGRNHPETPDGRLRMLGSGIVAAAVGGYVAARLVAPWATPVAAVGFGAGVALVVDTRPAKRVHERVRAVEAGLDDACYLVGRRVAAGEAVETALAEAADRLTGATGALLADAAGRQRRLGITVGEAFDDEYGALAALPSRRAHEAATLFSLAATEGQPAGEALVATAEHVEALGRIERDARRELAQVTDTLSNTAAVFGPVVGGATVALSARVARTGTTAGFGAAPLPTAELGIAVGAYVLWLAAALTALSTGLTHGLDRTLVGYRVGVATCLATACYLVAFVGAGLFL
ncbi:MAG: type II secretion system F family protein [Haloplanus sp.]